MDALWAFSAILLKCWVLLRARNKVPELPEQMHSNGLSRTRGSKRTLPCCCSWTGWSITGHPPWTPTHKVSLQSVRTACQGTQQLWQFPGPCLSGQMAEQYGRHWSTAKSGVGRAHRFILIWTNREVGYLRDAKWLLTEPDHGLHTTGTVGEGTEASPCGAGIWEHRNILCAALCQWGWTIRRVFICSNGTLAVNATLLLEEAEKPKGSAGERSRRWLLSPDELMGDWQVPSG